MGMGESRHDRAGFPRRTCGARSAAGIRADQPAGAYPGHTARRCARARTDRIRAHHRGRAHRVAGLRSCACRPVASRCRTIFRRCVFSPGPILFSTANNCSPRPIPGRMRTARCSRSLGLHPVAAGRRGRSAYRKDRLTRSPRADAPRVRSWVPAQTELQTPSFPDRPVRRSPGGSRRRPCPGPRAGFPRP